MPNFKAIRVEITEHDITAGCIGSCQFCPIARAAQRALNCSRVNVGVGCIEFTLADPYLSRISDERWYTLGLPERATQFIRKFDRHKTVKPFAFTVDINLDRLADDDERAHFAAL